MTFQQLGLSAPLVRAVTALGYTRPTPIQAKAIGPVLAGHDLLGCAQTGTGKTAAFALPILQNLSQRRPDRTGVRCLILTPTRELALQIDQSFSDYGRFLNVSHAVIFGGVGQQPQVEALRRGADVLTACPGRLNDLIGQGLVQLDRVEIFVLDEADRMLDMGFIRDVKKIIARLPARRQNLLFSATMPPEIEQLASGILHAPVCVKVDPVSSTVDRIDQSLYFVSKADKRHLLAFLLRDPAIRSALVFSRTKHGANRIAQDLSRQGIPAAAIHGNKSQSARVTALEDFKAGRIRVLVATDIAARGIDINELSHVINFDLPEVPETYVHRIGRTARAGADGTAISFCSPEEREYLAGIEKLNRKKIPVVFGHPWESPAPPAASAALAKTPVPAAAAAAVRAVSARAAQAAFRAAALSERVAPQPKEKKIMDEKNPQSESHGLSASAKRRRRRKRAALNAAATAGAAVPQEKNAAKPASKARPEAEHPSASERAQSPDRAQSSRSARSAAPKAAAKKAEPPRADRADRADRAARSQKSTPRAARKPAVDDDPGLLLISRRPPQQKYANFEEYMRAHGGATAPIEGEDE